MVEIIVENNNTDCKIPPRELDRGVFQIGEVSRRNKVAEYFDQIYTYPQKLKVRWDAIDELKEDLFMDSNYGVLEHSFPFIDFLQDWTFSESIENGVTEKYVLSDYINGYLDKLYTSKFYNKETKDIHKALSNIPVFVILNGNREIVLSNPGNVLGSKTFKTYAEEIAYDFCGAFDSEVGKRQQLGLIFFGREEAEAYLTEVARADIDTTELLGLSLHCISLESAYKITREYHPGVDFRFVPNMDEAKNLLTKYVTHSDVIFEDSQQQLRFRRRNVNLFPYLGKLGVFLSPTSSFLQKNEYFKGVPIYVVQINNQPRNIILEQYFKVAGTLDTFYGRFIQSLDSMMGFGHNWLMQGSLDHTTTSGNIANYVFFNKQQAVDFVKQKGQNVVRYSGSRSSNIETFVRKPKIYVYNFEDFLEGWEDKIYSDLQLTTQVGEKTSTKDQATYFINPIEDLGKLEKVEGSVQQDLGLSLRLKYQKIKRYVGVFFSVN